MPIETQKEKERFGNPLEDTQVKNFKIALDRKSEGRNIELHFKGPGSREDLEKALGEGKLPSGWEATVSYGKKGKEYVIDSSTLFDNYLKGTKFEKTTLGPVESSLSGTESTFSGSRAVASSQVKDAVDAGAKSVTGTGYRDKPSSGAGEVAYGVSKKDSPSSGATVLPFSKSRDKPSSGASSVGSSKSRTDETFAGARKVDETLITDALKREMASAKARGRTSSGGVVAEFEINRDQVKKGRTKNAAEEKPGDVAESD